MMSGVSTNCPNCGARALIADGVYDGLDGQFHFVSGPAMTAVMMGRLRQLVDDAKQRVREGSIKTEELLEAVAEVSPELASKLRGRFSLPTYAIILLLIWMIKSFSLDVKVDFNALIDQAYHLTQGEDPERHWDAPLPPAAVTPGAPPRRVPQAQAIPPGYAMSAAEQSGLPNRKARRRAKALGRKPGGLA